MNQDKKGLIGTVLMSIALALTFIYLLSAIYNLFDTFTIKNEFEQLGAMFALRYLMPFAICMAINFFLTGVGAISRNWIVTLISCILYFVPILLVPERFYCSTLQGILSFIAIFLFYNRGHEKIAEEEQEINSASAMQLPDLPNQK